MFWFFLFCVSGIIVESGKSGLTKQDKSARVTSCFEQMTYWNYDRAPSQADAWQQALEWTKVAEALHSDWKRFIIDLVSDYILRVSKLNKRFERSNVPRCLQH